MLNDNDLRFLDNFEGRFRTALNSDYARNVTGKDLDRMLEIYESETNSSYALNKSCAVCQLTFLKLLGSIYYKEKRSREALKEEALKDKQVSEAPEPTLNINKLDKAGTKKNNKTKKNGK